MLSSITKKHYGNMLGYTLCHAQETDPQGFMKKQECVCRVRKGENEWVTGQQIKNKERAASQS